MSDTRPRSVKITPTEFQLIMYALHYCTTHTAFPDRRRSAYGDLWEKLLNAERLRVVPPPLTDTDTCPICKSKRLALVALYGALVRCKNCTHTWPRPEENA